MTVTTVNQHLSQVLAAKLSNRAAPDALQGVVNRLTQP
jgi:uncharacterized membrane protein YcjF (UPF0283 family)